MQFIFIPFVSSFWECILNRGSPRMQMRVLNFFLLRGFNVVKIKIRPPKARTERIIFSWHFAEWTFNEFFSLPVINVFMVLFVPRTILSFLIMLEMSDVAKWGVIRRFSRRSISIAFTDLSTLIWWVSSSSLCSFSLRCARNFYAELLFRFSCCSLCTYLFNKFFECLSTCCCAF